MDDVTPTLFDLPARIDRLKLCPSCNKAKPASGFYSNRGRSDGLDTNCRSCRQRWYKEKPTPIVTAAEGTCCKCGETKPAIAFGSFKTKRSGLTPRCLICQRKPSGGYRSGNLRRYGLTLTRYNEMLAAQEGSCAICRTKEPGGKHPEYFNVDHDRSCCPGSRSCGRCVRGLLCAKCNFGLGNFRDDIAFLRAAMEYLQARQNVKATNG